MEKLKMQTTNVVDENIRRIGEMFPNCLTERLDENGKPEVAIDFDQLRQELSKNIVEGPEERYQFTWPDKRNAIRLANAPTTDTLRPCREESVDFDNTQNLYIEGDNLQVLKLLRENYLGKVKMIYIDPPYNTGNDFVYNDDFAQTAGEYVHNSGQEDEEGNRLVANTESNGRFHTDWLNMIYPRLKVARDLLGKDGVIFISIDNNEIENAKKLCDEVFSEKNCIGIIADVNNPKGRSDDKYVATAHEYILAYAKDAEYVMWYGFEPSDENIIKRYNKIDQNGKKYREIDLRKTGENDLREDRPNLFYYFYYNQETGDFYPSRGNQGRDGYIVIRPLREDGKEGNWRWGLETTSSQITQLIPKFMPSRKVWGVMQKDYLEGRSLIKPTSAWTFKDVNSERGTEDFINLGFDKRIFPKPKPVGTIMRCAILSSKNENDVILDFFSGSATTAHAVIQLNAEDGGNRKFIMVQLPETTDEKSEAYKAGFKNICEIGKERIRRAGKKILEEQKAKQGDLFSGEQKLLDVGFRVLKLDSSNMRDVYYTPSEFNEKSLFEDNIKPDRLENDGEDLLFQSMIELGIELSAKIEKREIAGKTVWNVSNGYLLACFDTDVNETTITEIARQHPYYFVMRDSSLATDNVADNFEQIWEEYSKDTVRRIL
ncbi:MAG: site-specific DNA-methyltransferase [Bacteroidaceae bacterium]|nr:site-specific DNA-methyltransferase [Bacteroidaceae bacterium]